MDTPAFLVAYPFLDTWREVRSGETPLRCRRWVLDSGAWSVSNQQIKIDVEDFIRTCLELLAGEDPPAEIFSLDVIGDWKASLENAERMMEAGVPVIPTYHQGEPEHALLTMAREYPKIAIGGVAGSPAQTRMAWAGQCFARVWPKKVHGFSFCSVGFVEALPWHSVDSTAWFLQPMRYRRWKAFGKGDRPKFKDSIVSNLRMEVDYHLALERRVRWKWQQQMEELGDPDGPTLYLAHAGVTLPTGYEMDPISD